MQSALCAAYAFSHEMKDVYLLKVNEILERNGIKIPTTGGGVWGGTKRRKSENFAEARSVKIKTEAGESANKSLSRIHQCK